MRIADRMLVDSVRNNLNSNTERLAKIEGQLSSGKRINVPSDDPAATASALRFRTDVNVTGQYMRTADASNARLSAADSAMSSVTDVLQRAHELTVQAGTATITDQQRAAIGTEVNQLVGRAILLGNTNFGGQYLFAGTKTTTPPFSTVGGVPDAPASVAYNGNAVAVISDLGQGVQTRVDVPGDTAVLPSINALIQLRDSLNSGAFIGGAAQASSQAIDSALNGVLQVRGSIGARVNSLDSLSTQMTSDQTNLQQVQSQLEDIDIADTIVKVNQSQNVYQAALGAASRAIQHTLVDFLH